MITRFAAICLALAFSLGCEAEIGSPCEPVAFSKERVRSEVGSNYLIQNVGFENCSQALCLSTDGSRGYCTKECTSDLECAEAGAGFTCLAVISFGTLACTDWVDPKTCESGEQCDCLRADGTLSPNRRRYCAAPRDVIDARDVEFGREITPIEE
jgi:hypothetical protein